MTKFRVKFDGVIEGEDIEQVIARIGDHFTKLGNGILPPDLFVPGTDREFAIISEDAEDPR